MSGGVPIEQQEESDDDEDLQGLGLSYGGGDHESDEVDQIEPNEDFKMEDDVEANEEELEEEIELAASVLVSPQKQQSTSSVAKDSKFKKKETPEKKAVEKKD